MSHGMTKAQGRESHLSGRESRAEVLLLSLGSVIRQAVGQLAPQAVDVGFQSVLPLGRLLLHPILQCHLALSLEQLLRHASHGRESQARVMA